MCCSAAVLLFARDPSGLFSGALASWELCCRTGHLVTVHTDPTIAGRAVGWGAKPARLLGVMVTPVYLRKQAESEGGVGIGTSVLQNLQVSGQVIALGCIQPTQVSAS